MGGQPCTLLRPPTALPEEEEHENTEEEEEEEEEVEEHLAGTVGCMGTDTE